jgi:hypothetical protein
MNREAGWPAFHILHRFAFILLHEVAEVMGQRRRAISDRGIEDGEKR